MASAGEKALHAALKKRVFDPVYYFHGDDDFLKDARIRELTDTAVEAATRDFNLEQRRGGDLAPDALDALLATPPMLAERRMVLLRDVDKLKKDARKVLDGYLKRPAADTLLLLVSPLGVKPDKTLAAAAIDVEFAPLTGDRVPRWVVYQVESVLQRQIEPAAVSLLIEAVGEDLAQLALELEKLASYGDGPFDEAAVSAVVGIRRDETVGALLDAVAARDAGAALRMLPGVMEQSKVSGVLLVMNLTTQTLALGYGVAARARGVQPRAMYSEFMGLLKETGAFPGRPWGEAVSTWTRHADQWTELAIDEALTALLRADEALKETRLSSEAQVVASLILALCGSGSSRRVA